MSFINIYQIQENAGALSYMLLSVCKHL